MAALAHPPTHTHTHTRTHTRGAGRHPPPPPVSKDAWAWSVGAGRAHAHSTCVLLPCGEVDGTGAVGASGNCAYGDLQPIRAAPLQGRTMNLRFAVMVGNRPVEPRSLSMIGIDTSAHTHTPCTHTHARAHTHTHRSLPTLPPIYCLQQFRLGTHTGPCAGVWALGCPKLAVVGCQFSDVASPITGDLHVDDLKASFQSSNSVTTSTALGLVRRRPGAMPLAWAVGLLYAVAATTCLMLRCPEEALAAWLQAVLVSLLWDILVWQVWVDGAMGCWDAF